MCIDASVDLCVLIGIAVLCMGVWVYEVLR